MKIITGYQGRAHIASKDDQGRNRGMMGAASYVLGGVNTFAATLVSNNELQIGAGEGIHQGVHFRVEPGSYDSLTIENGTQGKKRKDLIVCRYTKDSSTGVENTAWVVIKGTPADSSPVRPAYTSGDIASGAATADMPFYELTIDGINVTAVTPLFSVLKTMKELQDQAQTNANAIASLNSRINHAATTGPIDIKGYNSSTNYYVFPEDGYVTVNSGSGATADTYIRYVTKTSDGANAALNYMNVTGSYQAQSLFVKRGMYGFLQGTNATNQYEITYVPLNR